jgi:hypothetical protein
VEEYLSIDGYLGFKRSDSEVNKLYWDLGGKNLSVAKMPGQNPPLQPRSLNGLMFDFLMFENPALTYLESWINPGIGATRKFPDRSAANLPILRLRKLRPLKLFHKNQNKWGILVKAYLGSSP